MRGYPCEHRTARKIAPSPLEKRMDEVPMRGLRRIVVANRLQGGHELRAAPPLNGAEPRDLDDGGHIERAYRLF